MMKGPPTFLDARDSPDLTTLVPTACLVLDLEATLLLHLLPGPWD